MTLLCLFMFAAGCAETLVPQNPTPIEFGVEEQPTGRVLIMQILSPELSGRQIPALSEEVLFLQGSPRSSRDRWRLWVRRRIGDARVAIFEGIVTRDIPAEVIDGWVRLEVGDLVALQAFE